MKPIKLDSIKIKHSGKDMSPLHHVHILLQHEIERSYVIRISDIRAGFFNSFGQCLASWHRASNGILTRSSLTHEESCTCRFEIHYPYNLELCRKILIVSRGRHFHPSPPPSKTPPYFTEILYSLLEKLDWRLADADIKGKRQVCFHPFVYILLFPIKSFASRTWRVLC